MDGERHALMRKCIQDAGTYNPICSVLPYRDMSTDTERDLDGLSFQRDLFRRSHGHVEEYFQRVLTWTHAGRD